ncbi:MAG: hypothetical protein CL484_13645 [Acidobacteria bacterium]|nr:hypothetical protein [Acidobacteriota bacterium]
MTPLRLLALTAACHIMSTTAVAQPASGEARGLADLSLRLNSVRAEVEFIRREMGRPEYPHFEIRLSGATPRATLSQALTLFRKIDRLSLELARRRAVISPTVPNPADFSHSTALIERVLERIEAVKVALNINEVAPQPPPSTPSVSAAEALQSMLATSRQVDLLLDRRFSSSDVFQQVTLAINYTAWLLQQFSESEQIPETPEFERFKRPTDVYLRLLTCFGLLSDVAEMSTLSTLNLQDPREGTVDSTSGQSYDLASLLASELAYLHSRTTGGNSSIEAYYPGHKLPSETYQRVGVLESQLTQLLALVATSPDWLAPSMPQ